MLLAVRAARRGDEVAGFSLCALTGLLISPISWSHHWVLAIPALLLFALNALRRPWLRRRRSRRSRGGGRLLTHDLVGAGQPSPALRAASRSAPAPLRRRLCPSRPDCPGLGRPGGPQPNESAERPRWARRLRVLSVRRRQHAQSANGAMRTASGTPHRIRSANRPRGTAAASARISSTSSSLEVAPRIPPHDLGDVRGSHVPHASPAPSTIAPHCR